MLQLAISAHYFLFLPVKSAIGEMCNIDSIFAGRLKLFNPNEISAKFLIKSPLIPVCRHSLCLGASLCAKIHLLYPKKNTAAQLVLLLPKIPN